MASLLEQIEALLAEPVAAAADRERTTFAAQLRETDGTVVVFGAGRLGRLCARGLRRAGITLRAFCDRNPSLHGTVVDDVDILSPADAAKRYGGESLFVIAIWTGTARETMNERVAGLLRLGCRHVASYALLVWAHGGEDTPFHSFDLPTRILARGEELRRLARLLGDDESLRVLLAALRQRLRGEFDGDPPAPDQYFPSDLVLLREDEVMVDGGAFDGDTLDGFLKRTKGKFSAYHAFEPDTANLGRLLQRIAELPPAWREKITVHPVALHDREAELSFASHGGQTSQVASTGAVRVKGRPLDAIMPEQTVTFLKLDVEGAERSALLGAQQLLRKDQPLAAVCVYHEPTDLWEIPLQLQDWLPRSRLFLRQHGFDGWEMVCYAISSERLLGADAASADHLAALAPRRPCPVCESTGPREMLHRQQFFEGPLGDGYDVGICGNCGAGFADGIPSQEDLDRYYAERSKYTYAHNGGAESRYDLKRFELIADQIELHLPNKAARILDIGCATGGLLAELKKRGYQNLVGSDPAPACAGAARKHYDLDVRTATLREHALWPDRFDAVLLVGVLEHLREVGAAVRIAAQLLVPEGFLYCAQPDVEAFADCNNAPYQQFSIEHVNFFSAASLAGLMAAVDLVPRQTWHWMVEWREGMTDSVLSAVFTFPADIRHALSDTNDSSSVLRRLSSGASPPASVMSSSFADRVAAPALRRYLAVCVQREAGMRQQIDELVRSQEPLLVWGTGTLTRRLLATTPLARANIVAFIDSSAPEPEGRCAGREIIAPQRLAGRTESIMICSKAFEREIYRTIREQLHLSNTVLILQSS